MFDSRRPCFRLRMWGLFYCRSVQKRNAPLETYRRGAFSTTNPDLQILDNSKVTYLRVG